MSGHPKKIRCSFRADRQIERSGDHNSAVNDIVEQTGDLRSDGSWDMRHYVSYGNSHTCYRPRSLLSSVGKQRDLPSSAR